VVDWMNRQSWDEEEMEEQDVDLLWIRGGGSVGLIQSVCRGDEIGGGTHDRLLSCLLNTVQRLLHDCVTSEGTAR
jgi:hypothetical protein